MMTKMARFVYLTVAVLSALSVYPVSRVEPRVPEAAWMLPWVVGALAAASLVAALLAVFPPRDQQEEAQKAR